MFNRWNGKYKIIVDHREIRSGVPAKLDLMPNIEQEFKELEVGDYIVSDRCAIERKEISDFFKSWFVDKKLLEQLHDLTDSYDRPILLLEGGNPLTTPRNVHPFAVQGVMNSIALMGIATLYSFDVQGTAKILSMLAEKEQTDKKRLPDMHGKRTHLGDSDQLVYIISAVPGIGQTTAYDLLLSFGTIQKIATAEIEELLKVNGIGIKTARQIHSIFRRFYL